MSRKSDNNETISSLLGEISIIALSPEETEQDWNSVAHTLNEVIAQVDPSTIASTDTSPTTDLSPQTTQDAKSGWSKLLPEVASKGIGKAGTIDLPDNIWEHYAPSDLDKAFEYLPDMGESKEKTLLAMATQMVKDGLLKISEHKASNFKTFTKYKSAVKAVLIADVRVINKLITDKATLPCQPWINWEPYSNRFECNAFNCY